MVEKLAKLIKILTREKVMRSQELEKILGSRIAIKRQVELGNLYPLGSGLYSSPSIDPFTAGVLAVSKYYPNAIISNLTALVIHQMSDESLNQTDVDIEKSSSIRNRILNVHRISKKKLVGVIKMNFQGEEIRIYNRNRSLCEAYKIDPQGPLFFKALKRYLKSGIPHSDTIAEIVKYDLILKTNVLSHIRQELADG